MLLGIDEVGRGPWAGPLVVGAVVLDPSRPIDGLTDSKKLSAKRREALSALIIERAAGYGLGWVQADELDSLGLSAALEQATIRAVQAVHTPYSEIIIDGTVNFLRHTGKGKYVTTMKKADLLVPSASAASIVAKVARDAYMAQQDACYPDYGFASHVGYGTAAHRAALEAHGVTPLHRRSFAPIARLLATEPAPVRLDAPKGTSKVRGDDAEQRVASQLSRQGYRVVARNWKGYRCEIDIVAEKEGTRYFVEVKYRSSANQGGGVAAITPEKLRRMRRAAGLCDHVHASYSEPRLMVASVNASHQVTLLDVE